MPSSQSGDDGPKYPYGWIQGGVGYQYIKVDRDDVSAGAFVDLLDTVVNIIGGDVVQSTPTGGPRLDHYVANIKRCAFGKLEIGFTARKSSSKGMGTCGPRLFIKGIAYTAWEDDITRRFMTILKARYNRD